MLRLAAGTRVLECKPITFGRPCSARQRPSKSHPRTSNYRSTMPESEEHRRQSVDLEAEAQYANNTDERAPAPQKPKLTLLPLRHSKIIHLVRHGQGFHNVAGEAQEELYKSEEFKDAHLTEKGWSQAAQLKKHIAGARGIRPEVVIVSPLTRALQTAVGAFGGSLWHDGDAVLPLMAEVAGGQYATAQPAVATGDVPFVAYELCREHLGVHPCDARRTLAEYREEYPGVDFSLVETEEDVLWKPDVRETDAEIAERGLRFLAWLAQRPETEIAVVSHSSFLHFTLSNFAAGAPASVQPDLTRHFANCELRTVTLSEAGNAGSLDTTWFHPQGLHKRWQQQQPAHGDGAMSNGTAA